MPNSRSNRARSGRLRLRALQVLVLVLLVVIWHVLTSPTLLPPIYFTEANQAAFFFGEPVKVFARLWQWFVSGEIYEHLWVDRKSTRLNSSHSQISYAVFCLKKKKSYSTMTECSSATDDRTARR